MSEVKVSRFLADHKFFKGITWHNNMRELIQIDSLSCVLGKDSNHVKLEQTITGILINVFPSVLFRYKGMRFNNVTTTASFIATLRDSKQSTDHLEWGMNLIS